MIHQLRIYLIIDIFLVILIRNAQSSANDITEVYNTTGLEWLQNQKSKIAVPGGGEEIILAPNRPNKTKLTLKYLLLKSLNLTSNCNNLLLGWD